MKRCFTSLAIARGVSLHQLVTYILVFIYSDHRLYFRQFWSTKNVCTIGQFKKKKLSLPIDLGFDSHSLFESVSDPFPPNLQKKLITLKQIELES